MAKLWEQKPEEPDKTFAAFKFFRDCAPPHSVIKVYCLHRGDPAVDRIPGRWSQCSAEYRWIARALAYDRHTDQIRCAATEQAVAEVHRQRSREIEILQRNVMKETASLAHVSLKDVME